MKEQDACVIYLLTNKLDGKIYVGQTWLSFQERMGKNGSGYKNSIHLYNALKLYGTENFQYTTLATTDNQKTANDLEDEYIIKYNAKDPDIGYNIKNGGSNGKHSPETIAKISQSIKNKEWSPEALEGKREAGRMSKGVKRGPHTEEWKQENSERTKEWHTNNEHPMSGKHHTEEAKQQMHDKLVGKPRDPEAVRKGAEKRKIKQEKEQAIIVAYNRGDNIDKIENDLNTGRSSIYRILDRNDIKRTGNFSKWTGKKHSETTKQQMSNSAVNVWKDRNKT